MAMKALRVHGWQPGDGIVVDHVPVPEPAPGEIRVRVRAAGISFVDLLLARGEYQLRPPLPFVAGSEFSGVVDAIGPGVVTTLRTGDAVCGVRQGAWAEFVCVPAQRVHPSRGDAGGVAAAVVTAAYSTALYSLRDRGSLREGETLLVLGASGGVGHAAVQLGRLMGAKVIAGASSEAKRAAVLAAGAHETFDSRGDWKETVKQLAGPKGVDVCFDPVGGPATDMAFRTLGWEGRHLMVGFASGEIPALKANLASVKGAALIGVDARQFGLKQPDRAAALQRECVDLYNDGKIAPAVRAVLPVERFDEAARLAGERGASGRVLFTF
jgi:NADPH2:quinone reductase